LFGLTMSKLTGTVWPPLATAYTDEFGHIEPDVYKAAGALWSVRAEQFARSTLGDAPTGLRLMLKAAALVSRKYLEPGMHIENLSAYLFHAYKRLVLAELEKENGRRKRNADIYEELVSRPDEADDVNRKILIEQIMRRMDPWTRGVFELLILGYSFEEIGEARGKSGSNI
jgi:hypothetical protein